MFTLSVYAAESLLDGLISVPKAAYASGFADGALAAGVVILLLLTIFRR